MSQKFVRSNRLTEQQATEFLDALDTSGGDPSAKDRRTYDRVAYRVHDVQVRVLHPEGGEGRFLVCARNLSVGGMSFIHGGFVYVGSRCEVTLPTLGGGRQTLRGAIASCMHRRGQLHEIGVSFADPIDPRRFIAGAPEPVARKPEPPLMEPLEFCSAFLPGRMNDLREAVAADNKEKCALTCRAITDAAALCKFATIVQESDAVLQRFEQGASVSEATAEIQRLLSTCEQAVAGAPQEQPTDTSNGEPPQGALPKAA